jgi:hypothetical protein
MVRDGALHGEATGWANQEGHGGLIGRSSVEGKGSIRKAWRGEMMVLFGRRGACLGTPTPSHSSMALWCGRKQGD